MPRVYLSHDSISRKGIAINVYTKVPVVRLCDMKMAILRHASAWFLSTSRLCKQVDKLNKDKAHGVQCTIVILSPQPLTTQHVQANRKGAQYGLLFDYKCDD